jgi:hypothetical protein
MRAAEVEVLPVERARKFGDEKARSGFEAGATALMAS